MRVFVTRIPGTVRVPRRFTVAWTVRPDSTRGTRARTKGSTVMIRAAIISMTASFVLFGVWTVNLISYHPATDLNPLAPLNTNIDWRALRAALLLSARAALAAFPLTVRCAPDFTQLFPPFFRAD